MSINTRARSATGCARTPRSPTHNDSERTIFAWGIISLGGSSCVMCTVVLQVFASRMRTLNDGVYAKATIIPKLKTLPVLEQWDAFHDIDNSSGSCFSHSQLFDTFIETLVKG